MKELDRFIELYEKRIEFCEEAYAKSKRDSDFYELLTYKRVVDELKILRKIVKENRNYEV